MVCNQGTFIESVTSLPISVWPFQTSSRPQAPLIAPPWRPLPVPGVRRLLPGPGCAVRVSDAGLGAAARLERLEVAARLAGGGASARPAGGAVKPERARRARPGPDTPALEPEGSHTETPLLEGGVGGVGTRRGVTNSEGTTGSVIPLP